MDRRTLSAAFRDRFRQLLSEAQNDIPGFLRAIGIDRSALSQLRDNKHDRLPRAETLRRIAQATGVSVDWLLALENAREGRQEMTQSSALLADETSDGGSPLSRWHAEAAGHKLRYVPALLPDMLSLETGPDTPAKSAASGEEKVLTGFDLDEVDLEIAMPIQTLQVLAARQGVFRHTPLADVRSQLKHIADMCAAHYPALRLHLFDGTQQFCAPFTVFGRLRASVYLGDAYISVTGPQEVRFFTQQFDRLVREAIVTPDQVPQEIAKLLG